MDANCKMDHMLTVSSLCRHGNQGIMDTASKGQMEDEFGTSKEEEVVTKILEKGHVIETEVSGVCTALGIVVMKRHLCSNAAHSGSLC